MADVLGDQAARARIASDLDTTLFVEAGAGSGKTTTLVDRVVALVATGAAELRSIAAITFTEKAATELRDRLRRELAATCPGALDQLDGAAIGTLHAFAQRILTEHPVEAGLPPRVEVLDEVSSGLEFERRWRIFLDELLADPDLEHEIVVLVALGVRPEALRSMAVAFSDNWDLVETRVPASSPAPAPARSVVVAALDAIDEVCRVRGSCSGPDKLADRLDQIAAWVANVRTLDDDIAVIEALAAAPSFLARNLGRKEQWSPLDKVMIAADLADAGSQLDAARTTIATACVHRIASALRRFTLDAAAARRDAGRLEFHDLLVLPRSLLRHSSTVRARLHHTYQRVLLDEFQDTDPIQIELAVRIAGADPDADGAWDTIELTPGHLFVVGDPKQSIYRFRRADIATFHHAKRVLGPAVELVTNFRSTHPVIDWVNSTFEELMDASDFTGLRPERTAAPVGAAVSVVGREPVSKDVRADGLRAQEAAAVAAAVGGCIAEGWSVGDGDGGWRAARLGDIAILVPARTSLPFLEDALEGAGIPFRAEASSLVYASRSVRDLLMVLRAVDDPTDHLATVSALRTPLFGCGDDDLFRYRVEGGGTWSYLVASQDAGPATCGDAELAASGGAGLVVEALRYLRELHHERLWLTPSELLGRIAEERRAFELGVAEGRARDAWRRLRFVIDQARAWHEASGGSLRQYLAWVNQQTAEGARVAEAVLPETDDDAVRIMTIHAAKGLEFPITILSGLSTAPQTRRAPVEVVFRESGRVGYRIGSAVTTLEYEAWKPVDEQLALEERIRLLYVACTRARDHLVVSLHRREEGRADRTKMTNAELLASASPPVDEVGIVGLTAPLASMPAPPPLEAFEAWAAERAVALERASRPTTIAATALGDVPDDPGLQKAPRDLDLPPWLKGRYGSAVGRAVHGVLQTVDLSTGERIDELVASQCEAESIPAQRATVRDLVRHALAAPSVREAAVSPHWREVYACAPLGDDGRLLEGYVDLLYRGPEGLVVVDYKTAATADPADLDRRAEVYRRQGASYAFCVSAATGEPVIRVTFLFLTPAGPVEHDLPATDLVGVPGT
ncbi:MAG: UvrD-helicase domain-containing protein [Acidimicrobiales bacterium]